jgi:hypothetical protein
LQPDKNGNENHYFVSMTLLNGFVQTRATCMLTKMEMESFAALPWQQWFRERASVLRYTYIACLV